MANATQRAERKQGMPRQSGVPSTIPTSTPPAPPPQPSGTPGTNNPGQSPPADPKPVGTPNPPPPPVGAPPGPPPKTGPQQQAPEQEAGDASTEPDAAKLEDIYARLMNDVDQRVALQLERVDAKFLGIYDQMGSVSANVAGLKSSVQASNQNMAELKQSVQAGNQTMDDMKELIKALYAKVDRTEVEMKLFEERIPNPIRLKEEILSDFRQSQAAATTAAPGPVTPAPLVDSPASAPSVGTANVGSLTLEDFKTLINGAVQSAMPTPAPAPGPVTPAPSVGSLTLEDIKTLINGAVRSAIPTPAPAPGKPVPDVLNQPPTAEGELSNTQILLDNLNPLLGIKNLGQGLAGMMIAPYDAADSVGKLQAGGMSTRQRGNATGAAQLAVSGAMTVTPWVTGGAAAYAAYTGTSAPAVIGTIGGTTLMTVPTGSLLAAAGAGVVSFVVTASLLALWRAYRLNNVAMIREQNYQREVLITKHNQDLINAIKELSAVSQPRTT